MHINANHVPCTYMHNKPGSCTADLTICPEATKCSPFHSYNNIKDTD